MSLGTPMQVLAAWVHSIKGIILVHALIITHQSFHVLCSSYPSDNIIIIID